MSTIAKDLITDPLYLKELGEEHKKEIITLIKDDIKEFLKYAIRNFSIITPGTLKYVLKCKEVLNNKAKIDNLVSIMHHLEYANEDKEDFIITKEAIEEFGNVGLLYYLNRNYA